MDKGFSKAKKIVEKLRKGLSISQIAKEEGINRHSVSLVKQTIELLRNGRTATIKENIRLHERLQELKGENEALKRKANLFLTLTIVLLIVVLVMAILHCTWCKPLLEWLPLSKHSL